MELIYLLKTKYGFRARLLENENLEVLAESASYGFQITYLKGEPTPEQYQSILKGLEQIKKELTEEAKAAELGDNLTSTI